MKKIYRQTGLLLIFFGFISCDSQLDLVPTDILVEKSVFADIQTAESALADVYTKLLNATSGDAHVIADASLSHVAFSLNSPYYNYSNGNIATTDVTVKNIWRRYYEAINVANVFIDKVPVYGLYNENVKKQHIAEARFCRAYAYCGLMCYFGEGSLIGNSKGLCVPLQLKPYNGFNNEDLLERSTNEEVVKQIIYDLNEAIRDLPENYSDKLLTRVRITKTTAYAMLSRVNLYVKNYQACIDASIKVMSNTSCKIDTDLLRLFPLNTSGIISAFSDEVIFGFPVSSNKGNFQFGTHNINYYNKYLWADSNFISSMDSKDKRRTQLIFKGNPLVTNPVTKFENTTYKFNNPDGRDDLPIIRLAEILLNKAEALTQLNGVNSESVDILNQIKVRSGLDPVVMSDFSTKETLLNALYKESYLETVFEGRARFDFIRTNRPLRNATLKEEFKTFPIPQIDIDLSEGKLKQNVGYN